MQLYINLVTIHPIIMAIIQFALLGTCGELISNWIKIKKIYWPFSIWQLLYKAFSWGILAVCIKYAFVGFNGFVDQLASDHYRLLPAICAVKGSLARAFAISALMNLQFGPFLVLFHRLLDNLIDKNGSYKGIEKGFYSLIWFWIPAHTITFILPKEFQILLAAIWSLFLGIILGFYNQKK